jgi:hypothetical protein
LAATLEFCWLSALQLKAWCKLNVFKKALRGNNMLNANAVLVRAIKAATGLDTTLQSVFHGNNIYAKLRLNVGQVKFTGLFMFRFQVSSKKLHIFNVATGRPVALQLSASGKSR